MHLTFAEDVQSSVQNATPITSLSALVAPMVSSSTLTVSAKLVVPIVRNVEVLPLVLFASRDTLLILHPRLVFLHANFLALSVHLPILLSVLHALLTHMQVTASVLPTSRAMLTHHARNVVLD